MLAESILRKTLSNLRHGRLTLVAPSGITTYGDPHSDLAATLYVRNPRFFSRILFGGEEGAGDSYSDGDWSSDDIVTLIRIAVRNLSVVESGWRWTSVVMRAIYRIQYRLQSNTIAGSKRNIAAHYDLSNDFFRLFLDSEMLYSSAFYDDPAESLEAAQIRKVDRICRKLQLSPGDHVLEIGTGWGAFAAHAATHYGCRVTTTTISRQQHDAARDRFRRLGEPGERIELLFEDYRNLKGSYDKVVSIEMFEAVGLEYYDQFFGACDRLLAPAGSLCMQTITMNEQRFPRYHRETDWIKRRIFPGAELSSISEILRSLGRVTSLTLAHCEDIGIHYALTLAEWRRRFLAARDQVEQLGFNETFIRSWDYYLAYCEGAFRERYIGDVQLLLTKIHNANPVYGDPASTFANRVSDFRSTFEQTTSI